MTKKYTVTGLVQGIGFRPYVKRTADAMNICGTVKNSGGIVEITASGENEELNGFIKAVRSAPFSCIDSIVSENVPECNYRDFSIILGTDNETENPIIPADIATCDSCLLELDDKNNRRYKHPFISCTKCGPRYSVIKALPYDRCNIAMSDFLMCEDCKSEYKNIPDIRCYAQTIACNSCGPVLRYTVKGDPIEETVKTILNGGVAAVKDIGGYHFVCLANNGAAAEKIRKIKNRDKKPFAVMFNKITQVKQYADISEQEAEVMQSPARPIVLVKKKYDFPPSVCGESVYIGAMLPCNPVQHMLTQRCGALVMTSGNVSGEPIITDDEKMYALRKCYDFEILSHNRRIFTPLDDSVVRVICKKTQIIRRARGYTPLPIKILGEKNKPVLAVGGDLKASFCYALNGNAYMSQYFGDLEDAASFNIWEHNIKHLGRLVKIRPQVVVSDMHPLYLSAGYADSKEVLQHHFAHMASVMAEHHLSGKTLGFIFDGTGFGCDKNVWGGEAVLWNGEFKRLFHLDYTELVGGDASAKDAAVTLDCFYISAGLDTVSDNGVVIRAAVKNHVNTVKSSSMGRLFDAVSSLLGICNYNSYEGECAIMLEQAAMNAKKAYPIKIEELDGVWNTKQLIRDLNKALADGNDTNEIALGFHKAIACAVGEFAKKAEINQIVLSGGVFANRVLTECCFKELKGFSVYINEQVSTNDGGIALGQAWYILNRGV